MIVVYYSKSLSEWPLMKSWVKHNGQRATTLNIELGLIVDILNEMWHNLCCVRYAFPGQCLS